MGKSFVLRNSKGSAVGYIQQAGEKTRCGISHREDCAVYDLYLLYAQGRIIRKQIDADSLESEWHDGNGALEGGCLLLSGEAIADTGKEMRELIKKFAARQNNTAQKESEKVTEPIYVHESSERFMRRCWPPNPCNLKTMYPER